MSDPRRHAVGPAVVGVLVAIALWWLVTEVLLPGRALVPQFSPVRTWQGLVELARSGTLLEDASISVYRLALGLLLATVVGVLAGAVIGLVSWLDAATRPVLLFLRMVSPLSWAPVAIALIGIGDVPVVALVAATAVWPILTATAEGVAGVDRGHLEVARTLGATRRETLRHVTVPSVQPHVLTGLRAAIGIAWVVIVPAEMLGVTSGLGYQILNSKDQLAYHHVTALIVVIGTIGFFIDVVARRALRTRRQREEDRARAGGGETILPTQGGDAENPDGAQSGTRPVAAG